MGNILESMGRRASARRYWNSAEALARQMSQAVNRAYDTPKTLRGMTVAKTSLRIGEEAAEAAARCLAYIPMGLLPNATAPTASSSPPPPSPRMIQVLRLSSNVRAFLIKGFLNSSECLHIMDKARRLLNPSEIVSFGGCKDKEGGRRFSETAWVNSRNDPILKGIDERARALVLPEELRAEAPSEDMQVVRYKSGGEFTVRKSSF